MKRELDLAWCREHLKGFAEMEQRRIEQDRQRNEDAQRYAGCERVVPKDERRVA